MDGLMFWDGDSIYMTSALSLEEIIGGVMAALHPLAAERCDGTALLTILEQHDIFSYEGLGDVLIGTSATLQSRCVLLCSTQHR